MRLHLGSALRGGLPPLSPVGWAAPLLAPDDPAVPDLVPRGRGRRTHPVALGHTHEAAPAQRLQQPSCPEPKRLLVVQPSKLGVAPPAASAAPSTGTPRLV